MGQELSHIYSFEHPDGGKPVRLEIIVKQMMKAQSKNPDDIDAKKERKNIADRFSMWAKPKRWTSGEWLLQHMTDEGPVPRIGRSAEPRTRVR